MPVFSCIRNIHQKRVKVYIGRQLSVTGNIKAGLEVRSCRSFKMSDGVTGSNRLRLEQNELITLFTFRTQDRFAFLGVGKIKTGLKKFILHFLALLL